MDRYVSPRWYFPLNFALDHGGHWQPQRPGRGAGVPLAHVSGQHDIVALQSGIYSTCDTLTCILLRCQYVKLCLCTLQQHKHQEEQAQPIGPSHAQCVMHLRIKQHERDDEERADALRYCAVQRVIGIGAIQGLAARGVL